MERCILVYAGWAALRSDARPRQLKRYSMIDRRRADEIDHINRDVAYRYVRCGASGATCLCAGCEAVVSKWAWFVVGEVLIKTDSTFTQTSGRSGARARCLGVGAVGIDGICSEEHNTSSVLTRIIHEPFCCNRRSAVPTALRSAGSPFRSGRLTDSAARTDVALFLHRAVCPQRTARVRLGPSRLRAPASRRGLAISRRTVMNNVG